MRIFNKNNLTFLLLLSGQLAHSQHWAELGGANSFKGNASIVSLCTDPKGYIYAAGYFTNNSMPALGSPYVAIWNGKTWSELGAGNGALHANGHIYILCSDVAGNIYAAGDFKNASGYRYVAKWDGHSWSELGEKLPLKANNTIRAMCADSKGNIYVGGEFTNGADSSKGTGYVAKWDGTTWTMPGGSNGLGLLYAVILTLCSDKQDNIYTAGDLNDPQGNGVLIWDGTRWKSPSGSPLEPNSYIRTLYVDNNGNIYAGGDFVNRPRPKGYFNYVAKWNGSDWSELGGKDDLAADGSILTITGDKKGNIYAAGWFSNGYPSYNSDHYDYYVAKWDGKQWSELGGNNSLKATNRIFSVITNSKGDVYAAGSTGPFTLDSGHTYVAEYAQCIAQTIAITQKNNMLSTITTGQGYQWLLCGDSNSYQPIAGATSATYIPTQSGNYAVIVAGNGCSDTSQCFTTIISGISSIKDKSIVIYPNPANEQLTVELPYAGFKSIKLYNMQGQAAIFLSFGDSQGEGAATIHTAALAEGMYILIAEGDRERVQQKVVIKHE